jgi:hypothetical protein
MPMISKQNIRYNQMTRGVEILRHNVYSHYTEFILESHIVEATVKEGISVIAANASQDYENLKNALNAQIRSNNSVWAKIATTLRERQDADNGLATQLEAQRLKKEENRLNAERAMARVKNSQYMEIDDNMKKEENDLKKQHTQWATTKREMKANINCTNEPLQSSRQS